MRFILISLLMILGVENVWGESVIYKITSKDAVSTEGTAPFGSSAVYIQTHSSTVGYMSKDNSTTLTLSGYSGMKITGITLSMHSNKTASYGTFYAKAGETKLAEISSSTQWSSWYNNTELSELYKDVNVQMINNEYEITKDENVVINIAASSNSLYIQSYTITYEKVQHHSVKWYVNGNEYAEGSPTNDVVSGKKVSILPTPPTSPDYKSTTFVGWTVSEINTKTDVAPAVLFKTIEDAPAVTTNVTYRAVFAKATHGEPVFISYDEVNTTPSDWTGTYVMVADSKLVEIDGQKTTSMKATTAFSSTTECSSAEVMIDKTNNGYSILLSNNKYLGKGTSDNTDLDLNATYKESAFDWTLSTTNISSCYFYDRYLMKNSNNGVLAYKPASNYTYVRLYKKTMTDGITYSDYFTDIATLQSLTISGTPTKTLYTADETFYPTGLVVTGHFSDDSEQDVTSDVTWEEKTVTVDNFYYFTILASIGNISATYTVTNLSIKYFYESFDTNEKTGGNDDKWSGLSGKEPLSYDNTWSCTNGYAANKCARFGDGTNSEGSAQTPAIAFTGKAKITFKAGAWNITSETTTITLSATSGELSQTTINLEKGKWNEYTVFLSGVESSTQITFSSANEKNNRFFLDSVIVESTPRSREVTIASGGLTTLYLDYATKIPDGAKAYYISTYDSGKDQLTATPFETYVPANTGIIVKGTAGSSYTFNETGETVSAVEGNKLTGQVTDYKTETFTTTDGWYYLSTAGTFKKYEGTATKKAYKAYLYLTEREWKSGETATKSMSVVFEDATDIQTLSEVRSEELGGGTYNLSGQQVGGNYKGIVIRNGKKYLKK